MGFFAKAGGLNVKVMPMNNAARLHQQSFRRRDDRWLDVPWWPIAREKGPITIIAPVRSFERAPTSGIIMLKNSPCASSDLNGKTLARAISRT